MTSFTRWTIGLSAAAIPLVLFSSAVRAEESRTNTTATSSAKSVTESSCPQSPEEVSKRAQECKAKGMGASVRTEGKCYKFLGCLQNEEKSDASASSKKSVSTTNDSSVQCAMSVQQVTDAIKKCKEQNLGAVVKKEGGCYFFKECGPKLEEGKSSKPSTAGTSSQPGVVCRKNTQGGCVMITCTDGFKFNSCQMGDMCKRALGASSSKK